MIDTFEDTLKRAKKVVFLTGPGISQESGISTFRGNDSLWKKYDPMKLASAQAFRDRRRKIMAAKPNVGHLAIANLQNHSEGLSNYSEYRWLTSEGRKQRGDRTSWKHLCN